MREIIVFGLSDAIGGVENYLLGLQIQLEHALKFVFFVETEKNMHSEQISAHQGEIVYVPREKGLSAYVKTMKENLSIYRRKTDTIYLNISNYSHERLVILMLAKRLNYKVIIHSHGAKLEPIHGLLHQISHQMIKRVSLKYAKKCQRLAVSERAGRFLYSELSFSVLFPGIDLKKFKFDPLVRREMRKQYDCEDKFVIGFVGRMVEVKNPDFAVMAVKELCEISDRKNVLLLMVGDGPLMEHTREMTEKLGIKDQVLLVGSSNQVNRYLQAMDCLVGTSLSEGMPLGIMEAQASGLHCICAKDRYPQEIAASELVRMISLEEGEKAWAKALFALQKLPDLLKNRNEFDAERSIPSFEQKNAAEKASQFLSA